MPRFEFTDSFVEKSDLLGIRRSHAEATITNPDQVHVVRYEDLTQNLYLRRIAEANPPYYLLVFASPIADGFRVMSAYVAFPSLCDDLDTLSPLQILEKIAERFGVPFVIGGKRASFILQETVPITGPAGPSIIQVDTSGLGKALVVTHAVMKFEDKPTHQVKVALAFVLNMTSYHKWVWEQRRH